MSIEELNRLAQAREDFIQERERILGRSISSLESHLLDQILGKFAEMVTNSNGIITYKGNQLTLTQAIDKIFAEFNANENTQVLRQMIRDLGNLSALNAKYFGMYTASTKRTEEIKSQVDDFMAKRIGLEGNKLTPGGFLDTFVNDNTLRDYLKQYTYKATTGGAPYKTFLKGLRIIVEGTPQTDSMLRKHYKTFAFDTYSQFDGALGNQWRQKLGLRAARYAGNLIDTSRDFCIKHKGKVYTIEEMETWVDDPDLPRTKAERDSGTIIGYVPWIDKGRWNCRHQVNWLSNAIAIALRPDLKDYFANQP